LKYAKYRDTTRPLFAVIVALQFSFSYCKIVSFILMRPPAQVQASIELLDEISQTRYPADRLMAQYFRNNRYIGSKDKAAISEYVYGVLRKKLSYQYLLEKAELAKDSRFLLAILLREQDQSLSDMYTGEKYHPRAFPKPVLEILLAINLADLEQAPSHVQLNVPEWIAPRLEAALGDRYTQEMQAANQRAQTDIRVNLLKSSLAQTQQMMQEVGYMPEPSALSPWGLRFNQRVALFGLDAFKKGWFEVQDTGSQILALVSQVKPGDKVVDFCAGAGGKTLAMAAMMENKGTIYACDVHSKRLEQLAKRTKRAGAHNVRTHLLSSEHDKWVKKHRNIADVVLIDAPCTGTGTWRRSPDSRWNLQPENLENLKALQQSILQSASRLVKPGGQVLFATCSLLTEENEDQIGEFLNANPHFELGELELPETLTQNLDRIDSHTHQLRLFPGLSGTDGFYVAALRRKTLVDD
jgi:16S rRNA (cytosine967-C5)-methyltransferase